MAYSESQSFFNCSLPARPFPPDKVRNLMPAVRFINLLGTRKSCRERAQSPALHNAVMQESSRFVQT